jgi:hypothetical protein
MNQRKKAFSCKKQSKSGSTKKSFNIYATIEKQKDKINPKQF